MTDIDPPAHGLIKLDKVAAALTKLSVMLAEAATLPELQKLEKKASAFRHLLRLAKFNLVWQNRFFNLRAQCFRRIGAMIDTMEKHKGGRPAKKPLPGEEGVSFSARDNRRVGLLIQLRSRMPTYRQDAAKGIRLLFGLG